MTGQVELDRKPIRLKDFYITLRRQLGLKAGKQFTIDLVTQLAEENQYSPVVEYLERVFQQHGNSSILLLDDLASRYFGTSEPLYNAYVKRTLIGAVARALQPGCKLDTALILQGKQGYLKSTFFSTLAGGWFDDSLGSTSDKDERLKLRYSWILEYAELERAFSQRSLDEVKAFLSCKTDHLRVPYGRIIESFPRHSILVGTTNREEFLVDPTGDRRFWIVPIQRRIDCKLLAQERDRIWAAAVALYRQGEQWWLSDDEADRSDQLNKPFRVEDPWHSHVKSYLDSFNAVGGTIKVYIRDILENCLQLETNRQNKADQMRVAIILKQLGFTKKSDSKGFSCWAKVLIPLTPTDTSLSKVSVPPDDATARVSGCELISTDTFSANFSKHSEAVAQQSEAVEVIDFDKNVSEVSVPETLVPTTLQIPADTSTDTPTDTLEESQTTITPSDLAAAILQCQTWAAVVEAINSVASLVDRTRAVVFKSAIRNLNLDEKQYLVQLLANHVKQFPRDCESYSWLPESLKQLKEKAFALAQQEERSP